jgi:hypothetical protein
MWCGFHPLAVIGFVRRFAVFLVLQFGIANCCSL